MSLRKIGALLPAAIALGLTLPSAADNTLYAKLKSFLPPGPGAKICYARAYDAKHLKNHPKQKVTEMVFFLRYTMLAEEERAITLTGHLRRISATTTRWRPRSRAHQRRSMPAANAAQPQPSPAASSAMAAVSS